MISHKNTPKKNPEFFCGKNPCFALLRLAFFTRRPVLRNNTAEGGWAQINAGFLTFVDKLALKKTRQKSRVF